MSGKPEQIANFKQLTAHPLQSLRRRRGSYLVTNFRRSLLKTERNLRAESSRVRQSWSFGSSFIVELFFWLGLSELFQFVARTNDGKTLLIQKLANSANDRDLMVLVIATVTAPFHWTQLLELLLPITEHVRFNTAQITNLTNGEVAFRRNGKK